MSRTITVCGRVLILGRKLADSQQGAVYAAIDKKTNTRLIIKTAQRALINAKIKDRNGVEKIANINHDGKIIQECFKKEKDISVYLSKYGDAESNGICCSYKGLWWRDPECYNYVTKQLDYELFPIIVKRKKNDPQYERWTKLKQNINKRDLFKKICNSVDYLHRHSM